MTDDTVPENQEPEGTIFDVSKVWVSIENGEPLKGVMLLDKDGNETEILFDAVSVLARSEAGDLYEVDIAEGSWDKPTFH